MRIGRLLQFIRLTAAQGVLQNGIAEVPETTRGEHVRAGGDDLEELGEEGAMLLEE